MEPVTRWIDRTFQFPFGVELFPCIVARLRGAPPRLEEIVRETDPRVLTRRPGDRWSMQEHIGHLLSVDELHDARIGDFRNGFEVLRAADMSNRATESANYNARDLNDILAAFRSARLKMVSRLESLPRDVAGRSALHPRLNVPMRLVDMVYFTAEHDDQHIARILEIRREFAAG